ncbi:HAL/PAL/TAL family ammonia-lyase [Fusibacter sp. JL298sf-3]
MRAKQVTTIVLGEAIGIEDVVAVARYGAKVRFSEAYRRRVTDCRRLVDELSEGSASIYGITTGLGENWKEKISVEDRRRVQLNNLRSHACSVGAPLAPEAVRAMMLVMLQHLGTGYTGIRLETLETLRALLNAHIVPHVPENGSVGYLSLEAHIALVLVGEGSAYVDGILYSGGEALKRKGIEPTTLASKEGLSLVSGTTSVTALTALGLYDAITLARSADVVGAMSLEVLKGTVRAMDPRLMALRPHEDQRRSAQNICTLLEGSQIVEAHVHYRVQDALSLRSMPQLHGAVKKCLKDSLKTLEIELNASVDNPLIVTEEGRGVALMGCNADGTYVGLAADVATAALGNLCKMSERRIDRLVNPHVSTLPPFLNANPGLNNGLMIPQYTAAGLMGQLKILCHPATVDNYVTCANQEDYVSMGYNAVKKLYEAAQLSMYIIGIELFNACQAQDFYEELKPAPATEKIKNAVRAKVPFVAVDCNMSGYLETMADWVKERILLEWAEGAVGELIF